MTNNPHAFITSSEDKHFNISISPSIIEKLLGQSKKSNDNETGGILIGHYDKNLEWAIISEVTGPPDDSQSGPNWFYRGIKGLQQKLSNLWPRQKYYLGEWHFHPHGAAIPSQSDMNQMKKIADSSKYHCPEPILILIGERAGQFEIKAYVFLRGKSTVESLATQT